MTAPREAKLIWLHTGVISWKPLCRARYSEINTTTLQGNKSFCVGTILIAIQELHKRVKV